MKRDLARLSKDRFDMLVIGGGIHGALVGWDATLRGLSVALIDRGDFGCATSQNSLKVIHGGLRYLQDGNIQRIRRMAVERRTWMRIAPHLVHPLNCLTPTYHKLSRSRFARSVALSLNDLLSYDHNRLPDPEKHLEPGRLISPGEAFRLLPGLECAAITGAAVWQDAQMYNSERLLLSFVLSAAMAGASVANYVEATDINYQGATVTGVKAKDVLSGDSFDIQARIIVNCSGVWIDSILTGLGKPFDRPRFHPSVAINLVTDLVWAGYAVGLPSLPGPLVGKSRPNRRSQVFFIVPWQGHSLIGTWHLHWPYAPEAFQVTEAILDEFIAEVNSTLPGLWLSVADVKHVHWGFLPAIERGCQSDPVALVREGQVFDHQSEEGIAGLITVMGVKYTTARSVAQRAVDLAVQKLGLNPLPCRTHEEPVFGGQINRFQDYLTQAIQLAPTGLSPEIIEHLVYTYGSEHTRILEYLRQEFSLGDRVIDSSPVIKAEIVHAIRHEMAQSLTDIVQRRTELGAAGLPDYLVLCACAELMGEELGWDKYRKERSIEEVYNFYPLKAREKGKVG